MVVLLEGSPISTEEGLLSLVGRPALGRVLVVPNFFDLRMVEATVFLGTFYAADILWYPSPDLCLSTILSQSSRDKSFDLNDFCSDMHCQLWDLIDRRVPFQIMSN